ncbi:MAG: hypothetical protein M1831_002361 [Alyxoria varia]|nr:MAG: hypothetical protein M1831_002361 [Alyxoria varia]
MSRPIEVIGSLNIDLVTTTSRVPNAGETIQASSFFTGFGGKGANQAVAAARLSGKQHENESSSESAASTTNVRMVGAVGSDQFGEDALAALKREGIDSAAVKVMQEQKTGSTVIIVEESSGENRILFTPGANFAVTSEDVGNGIGKEAGIAVFQLEIPFNTVVEGLRIAKEGGKETILNPAPAEALPYHVYKHIDHLIVNETEASVLSGVSEDRLQSDASMLDRVARQFVDKGVRNVIVTLGSKGVYWMTTSGSSEPSSSSIPGRSVKAVDTTAAGDTFLGAYAVALAELPHGSGDIKAAVERANLAASITVQRQGAQASIPHKSEVPDQ